MLLCSLWLLATCLACLALDLPFVRNEGDPPFVVLTHGAANYPKFVDHTNDVFCSLAVHTLRGMNVSHVAYTARGYGRSHGWEATAESDAEQFAWSRLGGDMLEVARAQGLARFVGGGSSMGSATAVYAAMRRPELFAGLILMLAPTAWESREARRTTLHEVADRLKQAHPDELYDLVLHAAAASDLPGKNETALYARIACPVLILAHRDAYSHPVSTALALKELIPHAELHVSHDHSGAVKDWGRLIQAFVRKLQLTEINGP